MRYRMTTSPSNAVMARVVLLAGLLLAVLLLPSPLRHSAYAQEMIEYPENGQGAVAAYTAIDPDEDDEISWTLSGDDADDFDIDGGVLTFKALPDYENPTSSTTSGALSAQNTYSVTVEASDGEEKDMTVVTVMVTNVDEDGVVTLSAVQPREATPLTATHTDPDVVSGSVEWQWYRSSSANGPWTEIEEETPSTTYTPTADDVDKYLRATASYSDGHTTGDDADKTAHGVSDHTVLADTSNKAPVFKDAEGADITTIDREVVENSASGSPVGDPVAATDANGDTLTYTLGGDDASSFTIDRGTGQIRVGSASPDYEDSDDDGYEVTVTAADPSDSATTESKDTITVTITVTDVDEDPEIADPTDDAGLTSTEYPENTVTTTPVSTYSAADDDDASLRKELTWSVSGTDSDHFAIGNGGNAPDFTRGQLRFKDIPDFEARADSGRNNVYNVIVVVTDSGGNTDTRNVAVTVDNVEEVGEVVLSTLYPEMDARLEATLTDPDGSISNLTWQWERGSTVIVGATSSTYTPVEGDVGNPLTATASYTDGHGANKTANDTSDNNVQAKTTNNTAPAFGEGATATREVEENEDAGVDIGDAVTAQDSQDRLTYSLGGTDRDSFSIDRTDGQLSTKAALDYEKKSRYTVTVTVEDSSLAKDTITVTINVTDVDEPPMATGGETEIEYAEKGTSAVGTYTATDPEDDHARPRKPLMWSLLEVDDYTSFTISERGVLSFNSPPDYENPGDTGTDNTYAVTVVATDSGDDTRDVTSAEWRVTVTVTNEDEDGEITLSTLQPQEATVLTATLTDPDGSIADVTWQWARSTNRRTWTDIEGATSSGGVTATYRPVADDVRSYLRATASYTDGHSDEESEDKTAEKVSANTAQVDTSNKGPPCSPTRTPRRMQLRRIRRGRSRRTRRRALPWETPSRPRTPNGDNLTYSLDTTTVFSIDRSTGQIRVGTGTMLNHEGTGSYTVNVTAADPSDTSTDPSRDSITVTITVTDVDEKPTVPTGETSVSYGENRTDAVQTYTATDPERGTVEWTLSGYDAEDLSISGGMLTFMEQPDYEAPTDSDRDNEYEVTVEAADSAGNTASLDVTVSVANVEEDGVVQLSTLQPMVGIPLTADLTDPDGNISGLMWPVGEGQQRNPRSHLGNLHAGRRRRQPYPHSDCDLQGRAC